MLESDFSTQKSAQQSSMPPVNLDYCPPGRQIWLISINTVNGLMLLSTIPTIYYFVKSYFEKKKKKSVSITPRSKTNTKASTSLFYVGLIFMIVTFLTLLLDIIVGVYKCSTHHQPQYLAWTIPFLLTYVIQFYFLLLLLFIRLHSVFKDTMYELSRITVRIFKFAYILLLFLVIIGVMLFRFRIPGSFIIAFIMVLIFIALIITLMVMYIRKLLKVYKAVSNTENAETENLIIIITKTTILTIFSLSVTFLTPIVLGIMSNAKCAECASNIGSTTMLLDIYTNFLCIALSYKCFGGAYIKLCGCTHKLCKKMWYKIAGKNDPEMMELAITNNEGSSPEQSGTKMQSGVSSTQSVSTLPHIPPAQRLGSMESLRSASSIPEDSVDHSK